MKIAINGFGRIGRMFLRAALHRKFNIVAINDLTSASTLAHLFKYDSVHGVYPGTIVANDGFINVDGQQIQILSCANPEELPWGDLGVDLVIEATGKFANKKGAEKHLAAGAKQVLISAGIQPPTRSF